jgi:phenylpropionate dioxygenase-like ring-hydroxylating dioxygenase large terminal subunit
MNIHQPIPMLAVEDAAKLRGTGPLSSRPYYDPVWWELERKAIFMRTWLHIGHVCEIPEPGNFILRELEFAKASLLIVRGRDGAVRAFHNVCTHRGTQLVQEADGKKSQFSCPYHMWTYGTDGKLLSAPDFERFDLKKEDCSLKSVHCETMAGMIFVNLAKQPKQSLREFFGAIGDQLETLPVARATHFTEYTYTMDANWKTVFDNFQENYHLRFVHPRNSAAILTKDNPLGYPIEYGFSGPHRSQTLSLERAEGYVVPPALLQSAMIGAGIAASEGLQYPKIDFKCFPALHFVGLAPNFYSHTFTPIDVDHMRGQIRMYWTSENGTASKLFAREFSQMSIRDVLAEDRPAIESAQRGLSSGAMEFVQFQDHEMLPRHLYETVEQMVADYVAEAGSAG